MLRSLSSGVSGLQHFQQSIDVIGNNIANVSTTGYKSSRVEFADAFSQALVDSNTSGSSQIGTGVTTGAINSNFTQGSLSSTGGDTDLAIYGNGYFVASNPNTSEEFLTRAGEFTVDPNGYLVTSDGLRVQGFSDSGLTTRGDVQIDGTGSGAADGATMKSYKIADGGKITVLMSDGTEFVRGQVLLQAVRSPQLLVKEGNNLYSNIAAAGPLSQTAAAGSSGLGTLHSGYLESSNVDLTTEMTSHITAQRAFQANSRIVTTSDELLQEIVNLKR